MIAPADFVDFASDCLGRIEGEASARSAMSRAYYAVFHAGCEHLKQRGVTLSDNRRRRHEEVVDRMMELYPSNQAEITEWKNLRGWRRSSDYFLHEHQALKDPMVAVHTARMLLDWIADLPETPGL
jgi:uncharacterized protein (UPF0332 family)